MKPVAICDIETYHGYFLIAFKRVSDGRVLTFEMSDRSKIDYGRIEKIIRDHRIVTYNGNGYDMPLIWYAIQGASNADLKLASDRIIKGRVRPWDIEKLLGVWVPKTDHIDLREPQPNAVASLKTLNGRLHGRKMQDLPIQPDAVLTHADMDNLTPYCINDLDATELLWNALAEPIALREALSAEYGLDMRSKSDSQIGEAILKKRVEQATGARVQRPVVETGVSFRYKVPEYIKFATPALQSVVEKLRTTDFFVNYNGKVDLPDWLTDPIQLGGMTYAVGIGGLHSTEKNRSVYADEDHLLRDYDVTSYYPRIIINSGLYPKALGPEFRRVYRGIVDERVAAKAAGHKVKAEGLKISANGIFGKLGSIYSILYAPHLMIYVTQTGQLSLLMLIERSIAAGIEVISANTDGVVFRCPRHLEGALEAITKQWEVDTGFNLESTDYISLHSESVNTYIALKPDGKVKMKGSVANPWADNDLRGMLMKNPQMTICSRAVVELLTKGTPVSETIRRGTDIKEFVTVVNVKGGGTWRGDYLGKVVRYTWSIDGDPILYSEPHPSTGNFKRVSKSDGCRPLMELPDQLPDHIDFDRYIEEANEILMDIGFAERPPVIKKTRAVKRTAVIPANDLLALAFAA